MSENPSSEGQKPDLGRSPSLETPAGNNNNNNNNNPNHASASSSHHSTPFFADATLDLEEAHDIAETPEAVKPTLATTAGELNKKASLQMPVLTTTTTTTTAKTAGDHQDHRAAAAQVAADNNNTPTTPTTNNETTNGQQSLQIESSSTREEKTNFTRITSNDPSITTTTTTTLEDLRQRHGTRRPGRRPTWPRDVAWAVAFWIVTPLSLIAPILLAARSTSSDAAAAAATTTTTAPLAHHPLSTATLHACWWAAVATLVLSRIFYGSVGGGEGDDARHVAAQSMTIAAPLHVLVTVTLVVFLWTTACPRARIVVLVPLWYLVRDLVLFRRWKRQQLPSGSRQAFFQALVGMALDILSRSLRRASFYRVLVTLLCLQLGVLLLWRWAILGALEILNNNNSNHHGSWWMLLLVLLAGKWATGTVTRLLTLVACGGVTSWFMEQSALLQDLPPPPEQPQSSQQSTSMENGTTEEEDEGYATTSGVVSSSSMPEAYRTVDASVYQSVLDMDDDALDDDYEDDDDDEFMEAAPSRREHMRRASSASTATSTTSHRSTVKSILFAGLTVSFGSVAQCGLLGGLAQFIWSQVRKAEAAQTAIVQVRGGRSGFQGMQIGSDANLFTRLYNKVNRIARGFVRRHSDLAMSHVAAYYKSYQRAATDVAVLIDETGVEPILHDDITTHMCACVGGTISGVIVIVTSYIMLYQIKKDSNVTDWDIAANILLSFVLCYTLIFTVMEPLRAAIKAVYVSFAQHPRSLSQAFPLIFHRLSRLAESHVS